MQNVVQSNKPISPSTNKPSNHVIESCLEFPPQKKRNSDVSPCALPEFLTTKSMKYKAECPHFFVVRVLAPRQPYLENPVFDIVDDFGVTFR